MSNMTNARDKAERRRRKVIALFTDPTNAPTVQDAAKILGVSTKTIERDLKAVRPDMTEAESKLQEYQRRFKERLPLEDRVRLYEEIARQDSNLFARFKALLRIDSIDGIIPDIERLKFERQHQETQPVPMFVLPEGAKISVTVNQIEKQNNSITSHPAAAGELSEVRDITPQADTGSNTD